MNVSMQDGFNLGWKLGHVLSGNSPKTLLRTYADERKDIAHRLIEFDKQWSTLMAQPNHEFENPDEIENFYQQTAEFNAGYLTDYEPSMITAEEQHQQLAAGFPIGRRFKSAMTGRVCDLVPTQIGLEIVSVGRWRVYVLADSGLLWLFEALQCWSVLAMDAVTIDLLYF